MQIGNKKQGIGCNRMSLLNVVIRAVTGPRGDLVGDAIHHHSSFFALAARFTLTGDGDLKLNAE
jgi:hypothetical protein